MQVLFRVLVAMIFSSGLVSAADPEYNPLKVDDVEITSKTLDVKVPSVGRILPIRVHLPPPEKPSPVVLFSHGLGGSRDNNPYLGNHWAKRGYVVVFIQHPGSDESVLKDSEQVQRMVALRQAASPQNLVLRAKDVPAVIDALIAWNAEKDHPLQGRLDLKHIGMSGHSFGAVTTQAVSGQMMLGGRTPFLEPRISAAVMMSPSVPARGSATEAFASIKIPCLLMTGTLDTSPIGNTSAEDRLKVFPGLTQAPA